MKSQHFSINHAALVLERDRGTVTRALRDVPPDGDENGSPRWRLRTIIDALTARDRTTGRANLNPRADLTHLADEIETTFEKFDAGIARLRAEPDPERRRALGAEVGPLIGRLERLMRTANEADQETGQMMQIVSDRILGGAIFALFDLCQLQIVEQDDRRERTSCAREE